MSTPSKYKRGEGELGAIIIIVLVVWGAYAFFGEDKEDMAVMQEHPNYEEYKETKDCSSLEPENPYNEGSGHYAGFEWGENGNSCGGNSSSFIEGCEEHESQEGAYDTCISG